MATTFTKTSTAHRPTITHAPKLVTKSAAVVTSVLTHIAPVRVTAIAESCHPSLRRPSSVGVMSVQAIVNDESSAPHRLRYVGEKMRVLIVGGIPAGVVVVGLGSRVAMFILRLTSPSAVRGVESDDGFTIGTVTIGGTYNLLLIGAVVGIIGAVAYTLVAPWLIGPLWFRRFTTGAASAVVAGSALVHADGIDFTLLQPKWLAIGLFVALPGVFGILIGSSVDAVARPTSWTVRGRRRWLLPVVSVVCFPVTAFVLPFVLAAVVLWAVARDVEAIRRLRDVRVFALAVRSAWLLIAVLGFVALINDISALS